MSKRASEPKTKDEPKVSVKRVKGDGAVSKSGGVTHPATNAKRSSPGGDMDLQHPDLAVSTAKTVPANKIITRGYSSAAASLHQTPFVKTENKSEGTDERIAICRF